MYDEDELISAHVMNTERFENTQYYSFLSNVLRRVFSLFEIDEYFKKANN